MALERGTFTLQATVLVHEVYLRLLKSGRVCWNSRRDFIAAAAEAMRWVLIDHARARNRQKRGGGWKRVGLEHVTECEAESRETILDVADALGALEDVAPKQAEVAKLHCFAGMSIEEVAELLGISRATAYRRWKYARAWLLRHMSCTRVG